MTIDIIIPVFNCEKNIEILVTRLLGQLKPNDAIILVDDGSSDNSLNIMKKLKNENCNIKLIEQLNHGPAIARENGLMKATADFVWFIDSDDTIANNSLDILHSYLDTSLDMICFGICVEIYQNDTLTKKKLSAIDKNINCFFNKNVFFEMLSSQLYNSPCNKLFSRNFLLKNNIHFKKVNLIEDAYFITQVALKKPKVLLVKEVLYYYQTNISSYNTVSSKYYPDRLERGIELNLLYKSIIKNYSICNERIENIINSILLADIYTAFSLEVNNKILKDKIKYLKLKQNINKALSISSGNSMNLKLFRLILIHMPAFFIYYYIVIINKVKKLLS